MTLQAHPSSQLCQALTFPDASGSIYSLQNARLVVWALPSKGWDSSLAWKAHEHSTALSPPVLVCLQVPNISCCSSVAPVRPRSTVIISETVGLRTFVEPC